MRAVTYINKATSEKTFELKVAKTWDAGYDTVLIDDNETATRGRATRARVEARRAKKNN